MSFLAELKRRNVLKVAAGYALSAWIFIEAGSVLLPEFGAGDWFRTWVFVVVGGFIVAVVAAWVFEITPEGLRLESELDRSDYKPSGGETWKYGLMGLLVIALIVSVSLNLTSLGDDRASFTSGATYSSIAVLPFENRSADPNNRFFADGIHDDLLGRLATVDSLHVISRISVNEYRDTTKNPRQIGAELGVQTLVDGSVQRDGDQILIVVSLVDTENNEQIWSSSYNRNASMAGVFELQSEISNEITESLRAALSPEDELQLAAIPTANADAYAAYYAGINNLTLRSFESLNKARSNFEQAIELDPGYAAAHARLAETIMVLMVNHTSIAPSEAIRMAGISVDRALELDSDLAEAYAVRGLIDSNLWLRDRTSDRNIAAAQNFEKALSLRPSFSEAYVWFGTLRENENRLDDAIEFVTKAVVLDPLNRIPLVNLPGLYAAKGDNERSIRILVRTIGTFNDWALPIDYLAKSLAKLGRLDEALAWAIRLREMTSDPLGGTAVLGVLRVFDQQDRIVEFIGEFPEDHPIYPVARSYALFLTGDYAGALAIAEAIDTEAVTSTAALYPLMARCAISINEFDKAVDYLHAAFPEFDSDAANPVDRLNVTAALLLAFAELKRGNEGPASRLLQQVLDVTATLPRVGYWGHGILDARAYALQGRESAALDAIRDAIDAGFVSQIPFDVWEVDDDPTLASVRDHSRFQSMRAEMHAKTNIMEIRVMNAMQDGDWSPLLALIEQESQASTR